MKEQDESIICAVCGDEALPPESHWQVLDQDVFDIAYLAWDKILKIKFATKEYSLQW